MSGQILELDRAAYDALDAANWSTLKHLLRSPAHYRQALLEKPSDSDALRIGRVTHLAVLEPELFAKSVAVWGGGRRAGEAWDRFKDKNEGKELLTLDQYMEVMALSQAVRGDKFTGKYLSKGRAEVSIVWEAEGVKLKSRLDFISGSFFPSVIVDLKTTRDGSPEAFGKEAFRLGYHIQAALYQDAYFAATGDRLRVAMVVAEKQGPHSPVVYRVPEAHLDMGRGQYLELLRLLAECRASNSWPGYGDEELDLQFPRWAAPQEDVEELEDFGLSIAQ